MSGSTLNGRPDGSESEGDYENGLRGFATLGQFLEEDGWHPQPIEDRHAYHMFFRGNNGETHCFARIRIDLEQLMFYVVAPMKAPENSFTTIIEFITRANYGLRIGNFEFDYSDGEIRYKSSLDFEKVELNPSSHQKRHLSSGFHDGSLPTWPDECDVWRQDSGRGYC